MVDLWISIIRVYTLPYNVLSQMKSYLKPERSKKMSFIRLSIRFSPFAPINSNFDWNTMNSRNEQPGSGLFVRRE